METGETNFFGESCGLVEDLSNYSNNEINTLPLIDSSLDEEEFTLHYLGSKCKSINKK
jgi:hypothetical protein